MTAEFSILFMDAGDSGQGGSFVSLLQLISLFSAKGHQIHVVLWNNSPYVTKYQQLGAKVTVLDHPFYSKKTRICRYFYNKLIAFSMRFSQNLLPYIELFLQWRCYRVLVNYARLNRVNIIHTNNQPIRNFIGFWLAKKLQLPIVAHLRTLHGYGFTQTHINFIRKLNYQMIAVSNSAAQYWEKLGVPANSIVTIANPYDGEFNQQIQTKSRTKKLVYVGRLEANKGLEFLLLSFTQLLKLDPGFTLSIIGDGTIKHKLQEYCREANIEQQVNFLGYIIDAKQLLSQFDVLIFPSAQEGFGRVLLEAMAAKIPVIATRVSGVIDIVRHQYNGLLVDYNDCQQLVAAILMFYQDKTLANQLIENGYHTVINEFNVSNCYQQLSNVYADLIANKKIDLCVVISDFGAGGSQRVLMNLLKIWQNNYRIAVITVADSSKDFYQLPSTVKRFMLGSVGNSSNQIIGLFANIKRISLLRHTIGELKPRIVLSFICPTNIITILATIGFKTQVIISERNDPQRQSFGWIWDQLRKICYRFADRVTANTKGALQTMQSYVPQHKLFWVPNPLTPPPDIDSLFAFEKPTILAVGRLHPQKGYDILLHAFSQFKRQFPQWQLAIVGDGGLKNSLQQLAEQLAIDKDVIWYGNVADPFMFYRAATMFVMASRHEGMPNALLEAMSCALPIIVSDASPGPLEYIQHQVTGLVVAKGNIIALSQAMMDLAVNPDYRKQLGDNAQKKIKLNAIDEVMKIWSEILTFDGRCADEKS
jgi:glycosyltransferase involved in cell wall biosynthesis